MASIRYTDKDDLKSFAQSAKAAYAPKSHVNDTTVHITAAERTQWNTTYSALTDAEIEAAIDAAFTS